MIVGVIYIKKRFYASYELLVVFNFQFRITVPFPTGTLMGSEDTTSFGFVIDLWFNQFSTETYSNIVTAIWDRIRQPSHPITSIYITEQNGQNSMQL